MSAELFERYGLRMLDGLLVTIELVVISVTLGALVLGPVYFTWGAFALFLATCAATLCAGHSVGMHRRLIHNSFDCPPWLEGTCVYLGVLVGKPVPAAGLVSMRPFSTAAARAAERKPRSWR